jgi:protein-S-isoprenylcysteine O-methyltransferase Ste14
VSRLLPVVKTLVFTVLVPGTVALYVPRGILLRERAGPLPLGAARFLGIPLIAAGAAVYLWCAWDFATAGRGTPAPIDPPKELVARGLYRFVRNPMYVGIALVLLGEALLFSSAALLLYAAVVFLFFNLFVFFYEEPALERKFGEAYERYRASIPRWIPRIRRSERNGGGENGGKE